MKIIIIARLVGNIEMTHALAYLSITMMGLLDLAESVMTTACYALAGVFKNAFNAIIKGNYLTVCVLMVYLKIQKEFVNNVA